MSKLQQLIEAAKAAAVIDHNEQEGWYSEECIREQGAYYPKNARFISACAPQTILELCALLEKAEEVLADTQKIMNMWPSSSLDIAVTEILTEIKQWKDQK